MIGWSSNCGSAPHTRGVLVGQSCHPERTRLWQSLGEWSRSRLSPDGMSDPLTLVVLSKVSLLLFYTLPSLVIHIPFSLLFCLALILWIYYLLSTHLLSELPPFSFLDILLCSLHFCLVLYCHHIIFLIYCLFGFEVRCKNLLKLCLIELQNRLFQIFISNLTLFLYILSKDHLLYIKFVLAYVD